jgi:capsular polysaccharide biosynthesis protein
VTTFINNWKFVSYLPETINYSKIWLPYWMANFYRDLVPNNVQNPNTKIYITRKNAKWRKITNENELYPILKRFGYKIVDLDVIDVNHQIECFQSANIIVGIHGAGLVNMYSSKPGTKLLEIYPLNFFDPSYRLQSIVCGIIHNYIIGENVAGLSTIPKQQDIYIKPEVFETALRKLEN